ncbi:hypothetical protein PPACK8108_LOCUS26303 [Phakopsora pachyrhizi]|uniref:SAGA-associated factor 11 n=1 Tax=Phakopsora pachyrhizi TaxID=170000 RepID=A0AAV0BTJ3_PHAPC|nr:hypothetical protein PPACK8108_LOCUS26303 [Phakopsora pachyrhizi]
MDDLVKSLLNGLLEEFIWRAAILEHKRARGFQTFLNQQGKSTVYLPPYQSVLKPEIRNGNEKTNSEVVNDCPVCGREVASSRFAPHLSKCLGIGGRRPAAIKKTIRSDAGEFDHSAKASSLPPSDPSTALGKKHAAGNSNKKRGRPPKKPQGVILTPAEHDALLSNAINNATQRLHLQGIGLPIQSSKPTTSLQPHPLSQSLVASQTASATPPKPRRKKKKQEQTVHRSRNSSQASSSSDSEDDEDEEDDGEEDEDGDDGDDQRADQQERIDRLRQGSTPAGKFDDDPSNESMRMGGSERSNSTVPTAVQPSAFKSGALERPILRRRSSSQADSSDGSDSD